jgi:putative transposase
VSRLRRIADRDRIFFVTTNLALGVAPFAPSERDLILAQLSRQRADRDFRLFGYVVMPTHLHLLFEPERLGLISIMYRLKRFSGQEIAARRESGGAIWQARFYDFVLRRAGDFWDKLDYIHQNPVAAKLAERNRDWRWSSACQYARDVRDVRVGDAPESDRVLLVDKVNLPLERNARLHSVWP